MDNHDEVVERQKLVELETEEEVISTAKVPNSALHVTTVPVPKINVSLLFNPIVINNK